MADGVGGINGDLAFLLGFLNENIPFLAGRRLGFGG